MKQNNELLKNLINDSKSTNLIYTDSESLIDAIAGIDIEYEGYFGRTVFHYLAMHPKFSKNVLESILSKYKFISNYIQKMINTSDKDGETALHFYCCNKSANYETIECFIKNGSDFYKTNKCGVIPFNYLHKNNHSLFEYCQNIVLEKFKTHAIIYHISLKIYNSNQSPNQAYESWLKESKFFDTFQQHCLINFSNKDLPKNLIKESNLHTPLLLDIIKNLTTKNIILTLEKVAVDLNLNKDNCFFK